MMAHFSVALANKTGNVGGHSVGIGIGWLAANNVPADRPQNPGTMVLTVVSLARRFIW